MGAQQSTPVDAADLTTEQWNQVLKTSSVLRAWKGQQLGESLSITRAPSAAFRCKEDGHEVEVSDDSYTETREASSTIESEMILKAFTESGIHAVLAGGAHGLTFGFGGSVNWQNERMRMQSSNSIVTTVHGFYNFPRATIYLEPENHDLSPACQHFLDKHEDAALGDDAMKNLVLEKFFARLGGMLATRVTLGGRLCTMQEAQSADRSIIAQQKKAIERELTATIMSPAGGASIGGSRTKEDDSHLQRTLAMHVARERVATQGGNALLASSIPDWIASVESYRYWRVIQQTQFIPLLDFLEQVAEGTEQHSTVTTLQLHLRAQEEQARAQQASTLTITIDNVYESAASQNIFKVKITVSLPELVNSITLYSVPDSEQILERNIFEVKTLGRDTFELMAEETTKSFKPFTSRMVHTFKDFSKPLSWERSVPWESSSSICYFEALRFLRKGFIFQEVKHGSMLSLNNFEGNTLQEKVDIAALHRMRWKIDGRSGVVKFELPTRRVPDREEERAIRAFEEAQRGPEPEPVASLPGALPVARRFRAPPPPLRNLEEPWGPSA